MKTKLKQMKFVFKKVLSMTVLVVYALTVLSGFCAADNKFEIGGLAYGGFANNILGVLPLISLGLSQSHDSDTVSRLEVATFVNYLGVFLIDLNGLRFISKTPFYVGLGVGTITALVLPLAVGGRVFAGYENAIFPPFSIFAQGGYDMLYTWAGSLVYGSSPLSAGWATFRAGARLSF